MLTKTLITVLLFAAPQIITGPHRKLFSAGGGCAGVPSPSVDFVANTLGTGGSNITTWTDSSGNLNTATWTANFPTVDTTITTPNSTKTAFFSTSAAAGGLTTPLSNSTATTVCAVYRLTNVTALFNTLTGNSGGGGLSYLTNNSGSAPQLFYNGTTIADATDTPLASTWTTSCGAVTLGSGATFYLWNGTSSGVDTLNSFNSGATTSNGIDQVFGTGVLSVFAGNIARLTIWNSALNSTDITNYHACQVTTFGVP